MEDAEVQHAPADAVLPPLPPLASPPVADKLSMPETSASNSAGSNATGSAVPPAAPGAAKPNTQQPFQGTISLPCKKKRPAAITVAELDVQISLERSNYQEFLSRFRELFFNKDVEALISDLKANHESLLKPANTHRKIDEIIFLRDSMENLAKCKAIEI